VLGLPIGAGTWSNRIRVGMGPGIDTWLGLEPGVGGMFLDLVVGFGTCGWKTGLQLEHRVRRWYLELEHGV